MFTQRCADRGFSVSVLVCLLIPVLLLCAGLAVDGAAQAAADRRAEAVAAQAARSGMDAAAPLLLSGADGSAAATSAASAVLASHPEVAGSVSVTASGALQVSTTTTTQTIFLGLVGIDHVVGEGFAVVELRQR